MMTGLVVPKGEHGGMEVVKPERVQVICPACGQQVEAVASFGRRAHQNQNPAPFPGS